MKKQNTFLFFPLREKFAKTQLRLEKAIASGRFLSMSWSKKQELLRRLNRYAKQLGTQLKPAIAAAFVAAGLFIASSASAQTFSEITGGSNPLNGKNVSDTHSKPFFVDIDNDGDKDLFAGRYYSDMVRFNNTGTVGAAIFGTSTTVNFNGVMDAAPTFVDIDNDGDKDMFVGNSNGTVFFYPNTGTAASATFPNYPVDLVALSGYTNPLAGVDVGGMSSPVFVDIDNDGDKDCFIGNDLGTITYYKNTGTATAPVFTLQTGINNPFNGIDVGSNATPTFADLDLDNDLDVLTGNSAGGLLYFKNTGTVTAPAFTQQSGAANPFNGVTITGGLAAPAFVDIDNDNDQDLVVGKADGGFQFFKNTTSVLLVHMQSFVAQKLDNQQVQLLWTTTEERNSSYFSVQHSIDGKTWNNIGTVQAKGSSSTPVDYRFVHPTPASINYYRLVQHDLDGKNLNSEVRTVRFAGSGNSFTVVTPLVTNGYLQVKVSTAGFLNLLNQNGQLMLKKKFTAGTSLLDMSKYPKGIYYLEGADHTERLILK
jgi:hypothetical protein